MIVILLAAAMAAAPDRPATLDELHGIYDQSCKVRAYGSYDDLCNALRKQVREAEKQARKSPPKSQPAAAKTPPPVPPSPPSQTASETLTAR